MNTLQGEHSSRLAYGCDDASVPFAGPVHMRRRHAPFHRFYAMTGYGPDEVLGHNW